MSRDKNTILSHVYGIASLVPSLIGLAYLVKTDAPWQDYVLLASGWIAAIFLAWMLVKCFSQAREDGELIGGLMEKVKSLEKELIERNALLTYEDGQLIGELMEKVKALEKELIERNALLTYLSGLLINGEAKQRKIGSKKDSSSTNQIEEKR